MDYYGLLFLYYLKGLSGKSVLRLFFNIEAGGTEQLLPENTSTPTTTPILADIQYPDGLRTDQYFTYRETPTTISNKARIKTIKGNTLVWNQLVKNGNFASSSGWGINGGTLAVANNTATLTANASVAYIQIYRDGFTLNTSHKYLIKFNYNATNITNFLRAIVNSTDGSTYVQLGQNTSNSGTFNVIVTPSLSATRLMFAFVTNGNANGSGTISNIQVFDLTQMGLDFITYASEFTSLFPLSYYDYNQGSLLSFMGNGIKTVGKNLINTLEQGLFNLYGEDEQGTTRLRTEYIKVLPNTEYAISGNGSTFPLAFFIRFFEDNNNSYRISEQGWITSDYFTTPSNCNYLRILIRNNNNPSGNISVSDVSDVQLELGSSITEYKPYTSSTLSLPISTYFPNGMKSADNVYDELTPAKATTRFGRVTIADFVYQGGTTAGGLYWADFDSSLVKIKGKAICNLLPVSNDSVWTSTTPVVQVGISVNRVRIYGTFTSQAELEAQYSSLEVYYELATPIETPITTEDANEALSLLMGKSVSSNNAKQMIDIITKGE